VDFSSQLDGLQHQVADARTGVQVAATESRDQLRKRIDQAQADQNRVAKDAQRSAEAPASSKWKQMKADAAAKMDDVQARIDKRSRQIDADMAATDADMAEADATAAIDYAAWIIDNARLAVLDAIDARAYANMRAGTPAS
jgi:predicted  nucleic acid-binding Zn-ribbon protein